MAFKSKEEKSQASLNEQVSCHDMLKQRSKSQLNQATLVQQEQLRSWNFKSKSTE
jgi:hypothetical protein